MMETDEPNEPFIAYNLVVIPPSENDDVKDISVGGQSDGSLRGDFKESFAEMVIDKPSDRDRPLIILDAANIGWAYGKQLFSAKGLCIAVEHLLKMPVEVKAFLPVSYFHAKTYHNSDHHSIIKGLNNSKILSIVPSGESDDAYILNYARAHNAFIVSNDHYRDHLASLTVQSISTSMSLWLDENRCGYSFAGDDFVLNPTSALAFALDKQRLNLATPCLSNTSYLSNNSVSSSLDNSFDVIVQELIRRNRPHCLEHILLTRAFLALESGDAHRAGEDVQTVLRHINPSSFEAQTLLQHCKST